MEDRGIKILRYATDEELKELKSWEPGGLYEPDLSKGWVFKRKDKEILVITATKRARAHSVNSVVYLHFRKDSDNKWKYTAWSFEDDLHKAIKNWEFKQSLNPSTSKTFGDIIDEL